MRGEFFMFIVTAKLSKKKALLVIFAIALLLCSIILLAGRRDRAPEGGPNAEGTQVETAGQARAYLENLGWQVSAEPIEGQEILIPREWGELYEAYNALQREAGFDLTDYKGRPAVRYTYEILNYPGQTEGVVADVLIADGRVIGGGIQSIHLDGFIHGLFPNRDT